jgi:hypothetical protein
VFQLSSARAPGGDSGGLTWGCPGTRARRGARRTERWRRSCATAEIDGLVKRSPCIGIELPAETSAEEMHFITPVQVAALANTIAPRYHAAIITASYTGLRPESCGPCALDTSTSASAT